MANAIKNISGVSKEFAQQCCPVCGAPVFGGDANAPQGARCAAHEQVVGLFAEDIQRFKRAAKALELADAERASSTTDRDAPTRTEAAKKDLAESPIPARDSSGTSADDQHAPLITFLDASGLKQFVDRHRAKADEKFKRAQQIAERIRAAGHERRRLGMLPNEWDVLIEEFTQAFPNFSELAELLHDHFALNAMGDGRVAWSPLLLVGPAGIGKTEAARWLAERLALPFRVFDMASAQSGSPLAGSEAFWSNSEPGFSSPPQEVTSSTPGVAHIVHGPIACAGSSWDNRGTRSSGITLYRIGMTTDLSETDVVMGRGEKRLFHAIKQAIDSYAPAAVFVYNTCVTALIGDDVDAVCKAATERWGTPVVPVDAAGFYGTKNPN